MVRSEIRGEKRLADAVRSRENIEIITKHSAERISGEALVTAFDIRSLSSPDSGVRRLDVSAVFVAIGLEPDNRMFEGKLALDGGGYIIAGEDCRTSVAGCFCGGDTRTKELRQIITAASDGAIAAVGAANLVNTE